MFVLIVSTALIHMAIGVEQCPSQAQLAAGSCNAEICGSPTYIQLSDGTECPGVCMVCGDNTLTEEGECPPDMCTTEIHVCRDGEARLFDRYFKSGDKKCKICPFRGCW